MFSFHVVCISADKTGPHLKPHFKSMEHLEPSGDEGDRKLIVVSADGHNFLSFFRFTMCLFLLSLQEGSLIQKEIKSPCHHNGETVRSSSSRTLNIKHWINGPQQTVRAADGKWQRTV